MVVDVAVDLFPRTPRRATHRRYLHRVHTHHPIDDVDVVQVLFHNLVAADPDEGIPGAVLEFRVAPLRVACALLNDRRAFPVRFGGKDFANRASTDLVDRLNVFLLVAPLCSRHDGEILPRGLAAGIHYPAATYGIHREGLLRKEMLARLDRSLKMQRTIAWGRTEHHDVDVGGKYALVGLRAHEAMVRFYLDAVSQSGLLRALAHVAQRTFQAIFKHVAHRRDVDVLRAREQIHHGAGTATAAADKPRLQALLALAAHKLRLDDHERGRRSARRRCRAQKGPARRYRLALGGRLGTCG